MITLRYYKDSDWLEITDAVEPFSPLEPAEEFIAISKHSVAVTGVEDGVVMACGGVTYTNDDAGVVWVKVSKKCLRQPYRWARTIKETFVIMMESIGNLKLSTYVISNFCKGDKLARLIGLKKTDEFKEHNGNKYYRYTVI